MPGTGRTGGAWSMGKDSWQIAAGSIKTEGRGQRAEDRGQKTEDKLRIWEFGLLNFG